MTSMSSTLRNYTDLEEVSATLDKLKENALKKIRSINDVGDYDSRRNFSKINEYAIANNYIINKKEVPSKENDLFNDYDHPNVDTYDLFKNDASNKSKNLNDVFEYDFVNMDGCLYNEYQELHEGPYACAKQYERNCSDQVENLQDENNGFQSTLQMDVHQESNVKHDVYNLNTQITTELNSMNEIYTHEDFRDSSEQLFEFMHSEQLDCNIENDEDHYISNGRQDYSMSKRLYEDVNCEDEETLSPTEGVPNEVKALNLKYESSLYTCNIMENTGSIGNYSNDSLHKESCSFELDGEPMEDDDTSMQNSYGHMHNDINKFGVDNETSILTKRDIKMKGSSSDNEIFSADEVSNADENISARKNCEISSNLDIQEMNGSLNDHRIVQHLKNDNYEQRNKKCAEDGKRNELHYQVSSNSKVDEYNHRSHSECKRFSDRERFDFKDVNINMRTGFNKFGHKVVRKRFEDFNVRRRINDRAIPSHVREFQPQDHRKGFYHLRSPQHKMFLKRPNFNERRYNVAHIRYGNEFHSFRNSRLKDHFSKKTKSFYRENSKDNYKNTSQHSSPSPRKEKLRSNHSHKRLRRSLSPLSNEDDTTSYKDNHLIDTKRSPSPNVLDSRLHRFKNGSSGLGGYSPRRRRPDKTTKTPSPPPRSPDRKKAKAWDVAPIGIDSKVVAAISAAHTAQQVVSKQISTLSSISSLVSMNPMNSTNNLNVASNPTLSSMIPSILQQVNQPLSTVTLTQATRSIRRLYVGNVPPTVSDGELMEFMNAAMLSANANHIPRTKPCINCMVNIEKAYAFAEFITPEDATTALGFDGVTLHGTILKIRRPKDFIAPEHGGCPIAQPMINLVADIVLDSPQKIFIGGISSSLTPDKVKEIVTAFGQLKSFHWKTLNQKDCVAFLEYFDPTVTQQACIGLNGMHLGGQVLTVVQATPDAKYEVFSNNPPFYDIPKDALPLLEIPTNILKLYNLVSKEEVCNMQDEEVKELMEDVRFECRRFGNIRSMQLVKPPTIQPKSILTVCNNVESQKVVCSMESNMDSSNIKNEENASPLETIKGTYSNVENKGNDSTLETIRETFNNDESKDKDSTLEIISKIYNVEEKSPSSVPIESEEPQNIESIEDEPQKIEDSHNIEASNEEQIIPPEVNCEHDRKKQLLEGSMQHMPTTKSPISNIKNNFEINSPKLVELEPLKIGHIYIEYSRVESACQAAHALRGRQFGQLKVEVMYVAPRLYFKYFGKGSSIQTHQEKQLLSLVVQEHLTTHIKD